MAAITRTQGPLRWPVVLSYTTFVAVLVPVYWYEYGPQNFLWFSDVGLFAVLVALWTGWRLPYSMMAIGVLPMEALWLADFLALGNLTGTAAYMFSAETPLFLRALSGFHLFLPPMILWLVARNGYDGRALMAQTLLVWLLLPAIYVLTSPEENINYVFGLDDRQNLLPPLVYLGVYMLVYPLVVHLPMHALMKRCFGDDGRRGR